jgi:hypothetical protein
MASGGEWHPRCSSRPPLPRAHGLAQEDRESAPSASFAMVRRSLTALVRDIARRLGEHIAALSPPSACWISLRRLACRKAPNVTRRETACMGNSGLSSLGKSRSSVTGIVIGVSEMCPAPTARQSNLWPYGRRRIMTDPDSSACLVGPCLAGARGPEWWLAPKPSLIPDISKT